MNLNKYRSICGELDFLRRLVRECKLSNEHFSRAQDLGNMLKAEHDARGENLKADCKQFLYEYNSQSEEVLQEQISCYESYFNTEKLRALIDDLEGGRWNYGGKNRRALILTFKGIYSHCIYLSKVCHESFSGDNDEITTVEQFIRRKGNEKAMQLAEALRKADFLDDDYRYRDGLHKQAIALLGQQLGKACGKGAIKQVEILWGLPEKYLSRDKCKADENHDIPDVIRLKEVLREYGYTGK